MNKQKLNQNKQNTVIKRQNKLNRVSIEDKIMINRPNNNNKECLHL